MNNEEEEENLERKSNDASSTQAVRKQIRKTKRKLCFVTLEKVGRRQDDHQSKK